MMLYPLNEYFKPLYIRFSMFTHRIQLIRFKAMAEIKGEISRNYLGYVWWIIEPLMYLAAFYVVFGLVFKRGEEGFVAFLLIGLVIWKWFDVGVRTSMTSVSKHRGLLSQAYVPKYIFPLISVAAATFKFLIIFALLLVFLISYGFTPSLYWLALPGLFLLQGMLILGTALLVGAWVPLLQDVRPLIENAMMMLFFMSGIFFDVSSLSEPLRSLFALNPEAVIIDAFRMVLMSQSLPEMHAIGWVVIFSLLIGGAGLYSLVRFDRLYPKIL